MPNKNYLRGRKREYKEMDELRREYGLVMRTAGSHSPVDVIAVKETFLDPEYGWCFVGKLIQLKTSVSLKNPKVEQEVLDTPQGTTIMIEKRSYPTYVRHKKETGSGVQAVGKKSKGVDGHKRLSGKNRTLSVRRRVKRTK